MELFLIHRPADAEHLRNPGGFHGALVSASDATAAIAVASALETGLNGAFIGYAATLVASEAIGDFVPALIQGEVTGATYARRRGQ